MITLALLLNKLMTIIWEGVQATTVSVIKPWKKLLLNVVILKDVVVLLGVVGVLPKETIWLTLDSNSELDLQFNQMQHLKKCLGFLLEGIQILNNQNNHIPNT